MKILIVDDDAEFAEDASQLLNCRIRGLDIDAADNGKKGLEAIERNSPDLLITDIMMPGMSGIELIRAVRANPKFADMTIIAVSGAQSKEEALAAGANLYLIRTPKIAIDLINAIKDLAPLLATRREAEMHAVPS